MKPMLEFFLRIWIFIGIVALIYVTEVEIIPVLKSIDSNISACVAQEN